MDTLLVNVDETHHLSRHVTLYHHTYRDDFCPNIFWSGLMTLFHLY